MKTSMSFHQISKKTLNEIAATYDLQVHSIGVPYLDTTWITLYVSPNGIHANECCDPDCVEFIWFLAV